MSKKSDNIALQRQQALAKRQAIEANSTTLQTKIRNIQSQLQANEEKVKKIDYFLQQLTDITN